MALAAKYGMGVILVMHAAPCSQNGQDNGAPFEQGQHAWDTANPQPARLSRSCSSTLSL